jgi:hypothetical protein
MAKMKHEDIVEDKKLVKKAVGMHDKQLHGGKKTKLAGLKKGGPTSLDRKKFGKNLSRAMNQKSGRGR